MTLATAFTDPGGFGHMDGYGWSGGMNPWWILMIIIMVGLIIWAVVWSTRRNDAPPGPDRARSAESILADRFARGEIDEEEYRRRLDALRSS